MGTAGYGRGKRLQKIDVLSEPGANSFGTVYLVSSLWYKISMNERLYLMTAYFGAPPYPVPKPPLLFGLPSPLGLQSRGTCNTWCLRQCSHSQPFTLTTLPPARVLPGRRLPWLRLWLGWGSGLSSRFGFSSAPLRRTWSPRGTRGREWGWERTGLPPGMGPPPSPHHSHCFPTAGPSSRR